MAVISLGLSTLQVGGSLSLINGLLQLVNDSDAPGNDKVYGTGPTGTKGWYAAGLGGVTTVAGTLGQVLVNGAATPTNGAVTLTLASALTGINSITSATGQDLTLAGTSSGANVVVGNGTHSYITLNPTGNGSILSSDTIVTDDNIAVVRLSILSRYTLTSSTSYLVAGANIGVRLNDASVTVDDVIGLRIAHFIKGTGVTVGHKTGIQLEADSAATTGAAYGLYIGGVSGGSTNYAIYSLGGVVKISDSHDATDATGNTGAICTTGGVSIAQSLWVGTSISGAAVSTTSAANKVVKADASGKIDVNWIPTDELQIVMRQGSDAERQTIVFVEGEPVWTTDTHQLWVGDGVTLGGIVPGLGTITQTLRTSNVTNATDATGTTGAIGTLGGVSIAQALWVGGAASIGNNLTILGQTVTHQVNNITYYNIESYGNILNFPYIRLRKAEGSIASPTQAITNDILGIYSFEGYGASAFGISGGIYCTALEDFTNTARGGLVEIKAVAIGAAVAQTIASFAATGCTVSKILSTSSGRRIKVTSDTSTSFNFAVTDDAVVLSNVAAVTANLLSAATSGTGLRYHVYNRGAGVATIVPNGVEKINGASNLQLAQNESAILVCSGIAGAEWSAY